MIRKENPDIVFLDIQMPDATGFDVIRAIGVAVMPAVVFVTAYRDYAAEAFEVHAADYVVKPITKDRLQQVINRLTNRLAGRAHGDNERELRSLIAEPRLARLTGAQTSDAAIDQMDHLVVEHAGRLIQISRTEIEWIESQQHYVEIHSAGRTYLYRESLARMEELLGKEFIRIHRRLIVNMASIAEVETGRDGRIWLHLAKTEKLPVSRRRKNVLRTILDYQSKHNSDE